MMRGYTYNTNYSKSECKFLKPFEPRFLYLFYIVVHLTVITCDNLIWSEGNKSYDTLKICIKIT